MSPISEIIENDIVVGLFYTLCREEYEYNAEE
jgi:hypothetical protein